MSGARGSGGDRWASRGRHGRRSPGHEPGERGGWGDSGHEETDEAVETMAGFRRRPGGQVSARFTAAQAGIIRNLVSQIAELISGSPPGESLADQSGSWPGADPAPGQAEGGAPGQAGGEHPFDLEDLAAMLGGDGPTEAPEDPVLARLFPDAYRDDSESAGEFRRFTEPGLRSGKLDAARRVLATLPGDGGRVRLSDQDAQAWLRALNDVRLALGVRLGVTEDYEEEASRIEQDDPRAAYVYVYDWLTFLQDTLVRALW